MKKLHHRILNKSRSYAFWHEHSLASQAHWAGLFVFAVLTGFFLTTVISNTSFTSEVLAASEFFASPTGTASGTGTINSPWDLQTALNKTGTIKPGDTLWVRGGTYKGGYFSRLSGSANAPIVIRNYHNERAIIDTAPLTSTVPDWVPAGLEILGNYNWIWGLEFMSSYPVRTVNEGGPFPAKLGRWYAIGSRTSGNKLINLIVHDLAGGIGFGWEGADNEIYGNIVYYNGWQGPDDSHGHGIYTQNKNGIQKVTDNITFRNFSTGIHIYGSGEAYLDNIHVEGNTSFHNSKISNHDGREILYGGGVVSKSPILKNNNTYQGQTNIGHGAGCTNGVLTDNYLVGGFVMVNCNPVATGNTIWDHIYGKQYGYGNFPTLYPSNNWARNALTGTRVMVRPNVYEKGRAHVTIYNWSKANTVNVDLSNIGLTPGQSFEIKDVQNYFGPAVYSGTYNGGAIAIPMTSTSVAAPVGNMPKPPTHTSSEFGTFVVLPGGMSAYAYPNPAYATPYPTPAPVYNTPYVTPYVTPSATPYMTPYVTPYVTPYATPYATPYPTPPVYNTPYVTPYVTPYGTPYPTPTPTYNTPYTTPYATPYPTPSSQNTAPLGAIEGRKANGNLYGWAYDPSNPAASIDVHLYIDAPQNTLQLPVVVSANLPRTDVTALKGISGNHGFEFLPTMLPDAIKNNATHQFYFYGIDSTDVGLATLLPKSPLSSWMVPLPGGVFKARQTTLTLGQSTILEWSLGNFTSAVINNGVGKVSSGGAIYIKPTTTTTYTLTLTNPSGVVNKNVTVTVVSAQGQVLGESDDSNQAQLFDGLAYKFIYFLVGAIIVLVLFKLQKLFV